MATPAEVWHVPESAKGVTCLYATRHALRRLRVVPPSRIAALIGIALRQLSDRHREIQMIRPQRPLAFGQFPLTCFNRFGCFHQSKLLVGCHALGFA